MYHKIETSINSLVLFHLHFNVLFSFFRAVVMSKDLTHEFGHMVVALFAGYKALLEGETPVACTFVSRKTDQIVAVGYNDTNGSLNGTRHAEFVAIEQVLSASVPIEKRSDLEFVKSVFHDIEVYVTVEPCIMCASALRQIGVFRVIFGCANERFGGNGTVLRINQDEIGTDERYLSYGGILRTEAVQLLRNFYIQENDSAPQPQLKRNKELENKEYPENMCFNKYLSEDEFEMFYGKCRRRYWERPLKAEITPVEGEGYGVVDLLTEERSSIIKQHVYHNKEHQYEDDVKQFVQLFYGIDSMGTVTFNTHIVTMETPDPKRRKTE